MRKFSFKNLMYYCGLTEEYCDNVRRAAPMHDIGKIKISDQLLNKPGHLTPEARIMALADVYDALISERPYKKAFSEDEARRIIAEGRGSQFDPYLTDLFLEGLSKTELK